MLFKENIVQELIEGDHFSIDGINAIVNSIELDEQVYHFSSNCDAESIENTWIETTPEILKNELGDYFDIENSENWENFGILEIIKLENGNIVVNHCGNF